MYQALCQGGHPIYIVYVVSKGKVSTMRNASRSAPFASPLLDQIQNQQNQNTPREDSSEALYKNVSSIKERTMPVKPRISVGETFRSTIIQLLVTTSHQLEEEDRGHSVKSFARSHVETRHIICRLPKQPSTDRLSSVTYDFMDSE
ncbi:hypothetical protein OIU78_016324 [Salix suchowensis]|nr:hypothetical protein OIU78_016324 [Salix suchowensis]